MSPKSMKLLRRKKRLEVIRENILYHNYKELADMCGVTKRTIKRDVAYWRTKGGFYEFLFDEFFSLHAKVKLENPEKAYDRVVDLLRRNMPSVEVTGPVEEIKLKWQTKNESNEIRG